MRWLLACLVLFATAGVANAGWHERWVEERYQVTVYPAPVWERCDHGTLHLVQPAPHIEERTRTVCQSYWVDEPVVYVAPAPVYYSTPVYYTCPTYVYPTYVCPTYVYPAYPCWRW